MTTQAAAQISLTEELNMKDMANAIRALSMDAVQKANSGHPGMPMGAADIATVLFSKFLKFDPQNPLWPDRDRFILSAGHGSMLLYSLLYLTGYEKMSIDQIKNFRQLDSLAAGHPEVMPECGIEITTGPLGQGISSSVGFALAERIMNARFSDGLVDHFTYVIVGDGDLMEGISHEACALAGHLKLARLIVLYDDNEICIDGPTSLSYSDNVPQRFESYGWDVQEVDGHDHGAIEAAIEAAQGTGKPSMICCKTHIAFGAPTKQDQSSAHGAPLGEDEIAGARENLGWSAEPFVVPDDILEQWRMIGQRSEGEFQAWNQRLDGDAEKQAFTKSIAGDVSAVAAPILKELKKEFAEEKPKMATRQTSGKVLDKIVPAIAELIGGSADLTPSNNTYVEGTGIIDASSYDGRYIHYGVREHGMAAIMNGMALHGGIIPYAGTFLQFADYSRPAIRLAALMKQRVIHIMTHDSIGLGEDGPTHQPVEHLASLRAIPNLYVFRPCDGVETVECWDLALNRQDAPALLALTRQGLPTLRGDSDENLSAKGAYVLSDCDGDPQVTLFATGSEVSLAMEAKEELAKEDIAVRVVSVPCMDLFFEQDKSYIESLLCNDSKKIAIEAAIRQGWDRFIGPHGSFIGMSGFGESAPAEELFKRFKITSEHIVETAKNSLK